MIPVSDGARLYRAPLFKEERTIMGRCKPKGRYSPLLRCAPLALIMLLGVLIERSLSQPASPEIHVYAGTITDGDGIPSGTATIGLGQTLQAVPAPQTFTILNKGSADLHLSEPIKIPAGFTLLRSFGSLVLGPGSSTTFVVALNAGDAASYSGQLALASDDPVNKSFNFGLSGGVTPFPALRQHGGSMDAVPWRGLPRRPHVHRPRNRYQHRDLDGFRFGPRALPRVRDLEGRSQRRRQYSVYDPGRQQRLGRGNGESTDASGYLR